MKALMSPLVLVLFAFVVSGNAQKKPLKNDYVKVAVQDGSATSELLTMPMAMSPNLSDAEIGIMYFGPQRDSDISVLLILKGTKNRYSKGASFGARFFADDIPLKTNKLRIVSKVDKNKNDETLHLYLTTEELAWLATGDSAKIELYDSELETKYDTVTFTKNGFNEFKRFAKSVLLIKSHLD
ncbi:MAG: hypothetical protein IPL32_06335 [Chloracidobacterium sp.]|nr:hypothetical protein [Chloracidobacterium sp.]